MTRGVTVSVGVTHEDIAALEYGTDRRGLPRPFLPSRATYPATPDQARRMVERYREAHPDIAAAARASFAEDHSLGARSWGKGRHSSMPKTLGAEGRNWAGE